MLLEIFINLVLTLGIIGAILGITALLPALIFTVIKWWHIAKGD